MIIRFIFHDNLTHQLRDASLEVIFNSRLSQVVVPYGHNKLLGASGCKNFIAGLRKFQSILDYPSKLWPMALKLKQVSVKGLMLGLLGSQVMYAL